ncbi:MAG: polysaccharide biosynthesis protein [Thermoplasmatales archaeon]|nr:MAG: polysaccharide biosynthesis protein [Thermoplasmatales archaeon]
MEKRSLAQRFASGITWNIVGRILLGIMGLFISILIARSLGKENLGIYATLLTIPAIMRLFSSFGFETSLNIKLPMLMAKKQKEQSVFLVNRLLIGRIFISALFCLGLYFSLPILEKWMHINEMNIYFPYISCYFFCAVLLSFVSMIPRALIKIKEVSILESLNQFGNMILLLIFILVFGLTIKGVFVAYIISTVIVVFIFIFIFRHLYFGNFSSFGMGEVYEIGITASLASLLAFGLGQQIDILLLNYFKVAKTTVGFYYLAISIVAMFSFLSTGIGALSQSSFSEQYAKRGNEGLISTFPIIVKVCVLLSIPFGFFGIFFAQDIIYSLYGVEYAGTTILLQLYAACWCIQILVGSSFCNPLFYILRCKKSLLAFQFLIGGFNIVLDLVLIPTYGALGAIIATGVSAVLIGLTMFFYLWKRIGINLPWLFEVKIIVMCAAGLFCAYWVKGVGFHYLLTKGVVYLIVFILMAKLLKPLEEGDRLMIRNTSPFFNEISQHF